jgi:hypothetical protein
MALITFGHFLSTNFTAKFIDNQRCVPNIIPQNFSSFRAMLLLNIRAQVYEIYRHISRFSGEKQQSLQYKLSYRWMRAMISWSKVGPNESYYLLDHQL